MRANIYKYFEKPPTSTKSKKIGDIWFAKVKFSNGNLYKPRPVLIIDYVGSKYLCLQITSKPKGKEIKINKRSIFLKDKSYLTKRKVVLAEDDFYELLERGRFEECNYDRRRTN